MKREINLKSVSEALAYHLDITDKTLIKKALQAFIFVYNNDNNLDKLLPSTITPKGEKFYGKKLTMKDGKIFIDDQHIPNIDNIHFDGEVKIENNKVGARPIHLHGDFRGHIETSNLHTDSIFESKIKVTGDCHSDSLYGCQEISVRGKLACDNINNAEQITVNGKLDVSGDIKANSINGVVQTDKK